MKRQDAKIERYIFDELGGYIVEVEERNDSKFGLVWDAWLTKENFGVKSFMFGVIADQTQANEPHVYTREEALELIFANLIVYIEDFREKYESED